MTTQEFPPQKERIEIEAANGVALRQLTEEDDQPYFDLVNSNRGHLSQFGDKTSEKYPDVESVRRRREQADRQGIYRFGIWADNAFVGTVNLSPDSDGQSAELGYWIGNQYAGHGYARRATQALASYAFERLGLDLVCAEVAIGNVASRKSLERAGFKFVDEGKTNWYFELKPSDDINRLTP